MSALTVIMMMDSVCILPPLLHPVAEDYVPQRQGKKRDRQYGENNVLHKLSPETRFSANIVGTFLPLKTGNPPQ